MGTSDTLRSVIDAGRSSKRLDELSTARVIAKTAMQIHGAQQKAGAGKAVGPISPGQIKLAPTGEARLELSEGAALGYSAPEQLSGSFGDRRSDVFSLGAVLWEALTHQRLFEAMNDAAVRMAVMEREIQPPLELNANIPAELSAICMRALSRNPTDRYQSLKAMAVEIEEFLEEAGYADDDSKIATYLAKHAHAAPPVAKPASTTQPPPVSLKLPAAPSMLGEVAIQQEPRAKSNSGTALAAALANAGASPAASNGSAKSAGLPQVVATTTLIGVPKLDEWQDQAPAAHAPPPAAAPIVPVEAAAQSSVTVPPSPVVSSSQVVPSSSPPTRSEKSTIAVAVAPQVRVATVEAKHVEAKHVEAKPTALDAKHGTVEAKPATADAAQVETTPSVIVEAAPVVDNKPTLIDAKPPEIVPPAQPTLHDAKPTMFDAKPTMFDAKPTLLDASPAGAAASEVKPSAIETQAVAAVSAPPAAATTSARAPSHAEGATKRAPTQSEQKRSPTNSDLPHAAGVVSLPSGRDSKDVLAGWGWGTDKHNAIAPDGYVVDDEYDAPTSNPKKTMLYVFGGTLAVALLVTVVAFAFGGSEPKKKPEAAAKQADTTRTVVDPPAPTPAPEAPAPAPAMTDAEKAAAEKEAAAKLEADRIAAEKEQAKQTELAKLEAATAEADRIAAEKEQARQAEAARIAAEKEAKKTEAARIAAEKEARKAEAARIAADKKAEAARIAAEKKAAGKKAATKATTAAAPKPKTDATRKAEPTRVAKAEPAKSETTAKPDVEAAYRQGLQLFARGDTNGALASLRTALAGNPSYAPTWRGLGLVFEKLGDKDQARAAFKRYLKLAPGAGDADQIRSRLERLGS